MENLEFIPNLKMKNAIHHTNRKTKRFSKPTCFTPEESKKRVMDDLQDLLSDAKTEFNELGLIEGTEAPLNTFIVLDADLNGVPVKTLKDEYALITWYLSILVKTYG